MAEYRQFEGHKFITQEEASKNFANHTVDAFGYHSDFCDGRGWEYNGSRYVCCGQTLCHYCGTPMHGCTVNAFKGSTGIKYHYFCRLLAKNKL